MVELVLPCDGFVSGTEVSPVVWHGMASFPTSRHMRRLRIHSRRWQRRAIFVAGGLVVGLVAVALALASDAVQSIFQHVTGRWFYAPLVVTPLGFGIAVWLTQRFFPNAQGSGIPQAIAARHTQDVEARSRLIGLRVAIGKVLLTLFGLLVGASTGREGPTVQVGASIMFLIGRVTPRRQPGLILAGAAAGVAAAFNTPLAGIVFAIEEMSRSFEANASGLIIGAVILAGLTAQAILGDYTYFGYTTAALPRRGWRCRSAVWLAVWLAV
jgi:H+/Cl- antiporter ClcA